MLVSVFGIHVERNVFAFLVKVRMRRVSQALGQGGLAGKLVRKLPRGKHCFGVPAGSFTETGIERERGRSGLRSGLIRQVKEYMFGGGIVIAERDIGSGCRCRLQSRVLRGLARTALGSSQRSRGRPHRSGAQHQQQRCHDSSIDYLKGSWHQLVPTHRDPGKDLAVANQFKAQTCRWCYARSRNPA